MAEQLTPLVVFEAVVQVLKVYASKWELLFKFDIMDIVFYWFFALFMSLYITQVLHIMVLRKIL